MQRNWIGRSHRRRGRLRDRGPRRAGHRLHDAPRHAVRRDVLRRRRRLRPRRRAGRGCTADVQAAFADLPRRGQGHQRDRPAATDRPKTGVFLERYAINPVNGERLPIYAADYVLADYGTGAIMAVPAHDQRDLDFARAFDLPVQRGRRTTDDGGPGDRRGDRHRRATACSVNSGPLDGLRQGRRRSRTIADAARGATAAARAATNYRLRDWLISRQRYWGTPIPIIHCPSCGEVPVPDDQLPVVLPDGRGPRPQAQGHLAAGRRRRTGSTSPCPTCGGPAQRDTDTMDTFVDSSWYFLRFLSPRRRRRAVRRRAGDSSGCRSTSTSAA